MSAAGDNEFQFSPMPGTRVRVSGTLTVSSTFSVSLMDLRRGWSQDDLLEHPEGKLALAMVRAAAGEFKMSDLAVEHYTNMMHHTREVVISVTLKPGVVAAKLQQIAGSATQRVAEQIASPQVPKDGPLTLRRKGM